MKTLEEHGPIEYINTLPQALRTLANRTAVAQYAAAKHGIYVSKDAALTSVTQMIRHEYVNTPKTDTIEFRSLEHLELIADIVERDVGSLRSNVLDIAMQKTDALARSKPQSQRHL